jgi:putative membrane protein
MLISPPIATALIALVALVQTAIALVEIFLWHAPRVHGRLQFTAAEAKKVGPIVANAGLYNGFLAAGLVWAVLSGSGRPGISIFFLTCVIVAGVFGAVTLKPTTLLLQTAPGLLALAAVWSARL